MKRIILLSITALFILNHSYGQMKNNSSQVFLKSSNDVEVQVDPLNINSNGMRFWGWHAGLKDYIGVTGGSLNDRKPGLYFAIRMNQNFPAESTDTYWNTNSQNSLEDSNEKNKTFTGNIVEKRFFATLGLTQKLFAPFWLYAGGGLAINGELREFRSDNGQLEKVANSEVGYVAFNPEAGLHLKLGPITLGYGLNRPISNRFTEPFIQSIRIGVRM